MYSLTVIFISLPSEEYKSKLNPTYVIITLGRIFIFSLFQFMFRNLKFIVIIIKITINKELTKHVFYFTRIYKMFAFIIF